MPDTEDAFPKIRRSRPGAALIVLRQHLTGAGPRAGGSELEHPVLGGLRVDHLSRGGGIRRGLALDELVLAPRRHGEQHRAQHEDDR